MEPNIILNRIQTPDGTILTSYHRHDFKIHVDKNGHTYGVDGGLDYLKRIGNNDYTELSVFSDAPFEVIRQNFYRLNRGIDGTEEPRYVALADMDDEWLGNVTVWYVGKVSDDNYYIGLYHKEQEFRMGFDELGLPRNTDFEKIRTKYSKCFSSNLSNVSEDFLTTLILIGNLSAFDLWVFTKELEFRKTLNK